MANASRLCALLLLLCLVVAPSQGVHYLIQFPQFISSYNVFFSRYARMLTEAGNNTVTIWSYRISDAEIWPPIDEVPGRVAHVNTALAHGLDMANPLYTHMLFNQISMADKFRLGLQMANISDYNMNSTIESVDWLSDAAFRRRLHRLTDRFDAVISVAFNLDALILADQLNISRFLTLQVGSYVVETTALWLGLPRVPSYVPGMESMRVGTDFWSRLANVGVLCYTELFLLRLPFSLTRRQQDWYQLPPNQDRPDILWTLSIERIMGSVINGDQQLDFPRPLLHNIWYLGSPTTEQQAKPLPADIEAIVFNSGSKGVIVMSFGTMANVTCMPEKMKLGILRALVQFSAYDVVWRFDASLLPTWHTRHSHLHVRHWIPQRDLLQHARTVLFVTHGGYNSFLEASLAGVPAVIVPLAIDQHTNAARAQRLGTAVVIHNKATLADPTVLRDAMQQALDDNSYRRAAERVASMHGDQLAGAGRLNEHRMRRAAKPHFDRLYTRSLRRVARMSYPVYLCLDVVVGWTLAAAAGCYGALRLARTVAKSWA